VYNYIFLLPLYNDWDSCSILVDKINFQMKKLSKKCEILIIDDCSNSMQTNFLSFSNITKINILSLRKNLGSQKAISIGLQYLYKIEKKMIITILDSDGEDDASKIPDMIKNAEIEKDKVIVSTRTKRQENILFKLLYFIHKLLTFLFSLNWISYGNYSSFHSDQLKKILSQKSSWLAFSACVAKNCKIKKVKAERKKRLDGISKLSFLGLIFHSLRVNTVFIARAIMLSIFYILIFFLFFNLGYFFCIFFIFAIIIYNLLLTITFFLNNQKSFTNSLHLIKK